MKKLLLGTVAVITIAGVHCAMAADMPLKASLSELPPPPPVIYDWTGFYTGFNVGAAWGSYDPITSTIPDGVINASTPRVNAAGIQSINPIGFTGGAQAGYAWQWGNLVAGIEADLSYLHLNGEANSGAVRLIGGLLRRSSAPTATPIGCSRCARASVGPPAIGCFMRRVVSPSPISTTISH
jgi:opacity protein-like surface antigen